MESCSSFLTVRSVRFEPMHNLHLGVSKTFFCQKSRLGTPCVFESRKNLNWMNSFLYKVDKFYQNAAMKLAFSYTKKERMLMDSLRKMTFLEHVSLRTIETANCLLVLGSRCECAVDPCLFSELTSSSLHIEPSWMKYIATKCRHIELLNGSIRYRFLYLNLKSNHACSSKRSKHSFVEQKIPSGRSFDTRNSWISVPSYIAFVTMEANTLWL